jgi:hypothetical protein
MTTITHTQSRIFTNRCSVPALNSGHSPSGFPNYPRASATSFWQQKLLTTELQQFSKQLYYVSESLTNQPTQLNWPTDPSLTVLRKYFGTDGTENTDPLLLFTGRCLVVCFAVVAWQRVYMPQYIYWRDNLNLNVNIDNLVLQHPVARHLFLLFI